MATWPETLPSPTLAGYQGESGMNVQRTDFDSGSARQRKRYGDCPDEQSLNFKFTAAEMAIFRAFWKDDINNGTDYFLMDVDIGNGIASHEVRFIGGRFQHQRLPGANWQVSAKFDVRIV
jgi:hypothetical protein